MTIAIHQPNFFPWLGYFDKMAKSDVFVLLDHVQFVKNHICNRNKLKSPNGTSNWFTVPVSKDNGLKLPFNELKLAHQQPWVEKMLNQIRNSYKAAPYFELYYPKIEEILIQDDLSTLADLNIEILTFCKNQFNIHTKLVTSSSLGEDFGSGTEQLVKIISTLNGDTYLSGHGAKKYLEIDLFEERGIKLIYQEFEHPNYSQLFGDFLPNLSAIDLLMNEGPESCRFFS